MSDVSMKDFATGAAAADEVQADPGDAYSNDELAQVVAGVTSPGVHPQLVEPYMQTHVERTKPLFDMCATGDALAKVGFTQDNVEDAPVIPRLIISALAALFNTFMTRREYASYERQLSVGGGAGAAADPASEENGEVYQRDVSN